MKMRVKESIAQQNKPKRRISHGQIIYHGLPPIRSGGPIQNNPFQLPKGSIIAQVVANRVITVEHVQIKFILEIAHPQ